MTDLTVKDAAMNFDGLHAAMQRYVRDDLLAGVSSAVLVGRDLVDLHCEGFADRESGERLRPDHLFRAFSNTKLITSCAVLLLMEEGRLGLDDPIERHLPQLGARRVLVRGATDIGQTEPARRSITVRHLLTHSAGLSYGIFDPGTPMFKAYNAAKVRDENTPLSTMIDALEGLPLSYHPGEGWEYSVATDVLGRLVEVVSGEAFDAYIERRICGPLGMADTRFTVPVDQQHRLAAYYAGVDPLAPMKPGLVRVDQQPYPEAYRRPFARLSGGGGLVTSLPDMIALIRALVPGGPTLLKPETLALMRTNQLPEGQWIRFAMLGEVPGKGYGLTGAVTLTPSSIDPPAATGELQWGGIAGTHWWISPRHNLAGLVMTQRAMGFWHPFSFDLKRQTYAAALGARANAA